MLKIRANKCAISSGPYNPVSRLQIDEEVTTPGVLHVRFLGQSTHFFVVLADFRAFRTEQQTSPDDGTPHSPIEVYESFARFDLVYTPVKRRLNIDRNDGCFAEYVFRLSDGLNRGCEVGFCHDECYVPCVMYALMKVVKCSCGDTNVRILFLERKKGK